MDIRKQVAQIETQLKQIDAQAAQLAAGRLRAEGALMLARQWVAEEDAIPKMTAADLAVPADDGLSTPTESPDAVHHD